MMASRLLALLFVIFSTELVFAQTTLSRDDIIISGYASSGNDALSVLFLKDVTSSSSTPTLIRFTDNGVEADGDFRSGEGEITLSLTQNITAGTVIRINSPATTSPSLSSNGSSFSGGTISRSSGSFSLSTSGDQVFIYQGSSAPTKVSDVTMLYGLNNDGTGWQTDATSANTSALPTVLNQSNHNLAFTEVDNVDYDKVRKG